MTKVKNLNGTSDNKTPEGYSSWLDFWESESGNEANECGCCSNKAEVGAHVKKAEGNDQSWYIVPLCHSCNKKPSTEVFKVYETLVPVT